VTSPHRAGRRARRTATGHEGTEEGHHHGNAAEVHPIGEQRRLDQCVVTSTPLVAHEQDEQDSTTCDHGKHPQGPPCGLTLDEREDDGNQRQPDENDAGTIECESGVGDPSWQRPERERDREKADRHVDEKDQPPTGVPEVGVDEGAGENRCAEHGKARRRTEQARDRAEFSSSNISFNRPKPWGIMRAPKPPCSARNAMSMPTLWDAAQAAEKRVNPTKPSRNIRRRPNMSPSRAPAINRTAKVSV